MRTRRVTFGPVYSALKGTDLPSWSSNGRSSIERRVSRLGRSSLVLRSSSELMLLAALRSFALAMGVSMDAREGVSLRLSMDLKGMLLDLE